jgi:hypothetical protein
MRLPRVRFTVRRLMVAVAIVALLVGVLHRRARMLAVAQAHRAWQGSYKGIRSVIVGPEGDPAYVAQQRRRASWLAHKDAAVALEAAAWYPWAPTPADLIGLPRLPAEDHGLLRLTEDVASPDPPEPE